MPAFRLFELVFAKARLSEDAAMDLSARARGRGRGGRREPQLRRDRLLRLRARAAHRRALARSRAGPEPAYRLVDLGSGVGRALVAAALLQDACGVDEVRFRAVVGVELYRELHEGAERVRAAARRPRPSARP